MRIVVASDKLKGSLTSQSAGEAIAAGVRDRMPGADVVVLPVADGGEGTLDSALAVGWESQPVTASGPTGAPVETALARSGPRALVELADCCGLGRLPGGMPAPMDASSRGLGDAIRAALDHRARDIIVGIGGSASTDGGLGMLRALGAVAQDRSGAPVAEGGRGLGDVAHLDLDGLDTRLRDVTLTLASDVGNPLHGPQGAAYVYAPQKGATPAEVAALDAGLRHWAALVGGRPDSPGAGAAGGVGYAAVQVLGASLRSGVDVVLDLVGFETACAGADLVITGEGAIDAQTLQGKAVAGVARRSQALGVPVLAVCGRCDLTDGELAALGVAGVAELRHEESDVRRSMAQAAPLVRRAAARLVELWRLP